MIYLAGPLFTMAEINFNRNLADSLIKEGFDVYLPQNECKVCNDNDEIYNVCLQGIEKSQVILAILDGTDVDSGTSFEAGYAKALGKKIIGLRTDFRNTGDDGGLNLMLSKSCHHFINYSILNEDCSFKALAKIIIPLL
jgi:nucleoside 2-deoxyribosyltransferase